MHDQEWQWGYYTIESKWEYDDYCEPDYLIGKLSDTRSEYTFDRREGQLLGKWIDEVIVLPYNKIRGRSMVADQYAVGGKWPSPETWVKAELFFREKVEALPYKINDEEGYSVQWDALEKEFWIEVDGYEILADGLKTAYDYRSYRYADPSCNYPQPSTPDDIKYAVQDYERWEDLCRGWWSYMCLTVTIYKDNVEIASSSCGGIESDGGDEYIKELLESVTDDALHQANIGLSAKEIFKEAEEV